MASNFNPDLNFHKAIIEYIIHSSRLYLYSKEIISDIENVRPRQIDKDLYEFQKNNLLNFDQIQKNYERGIDVNFEDEFFV